MKINSVSCAEENHPNKYTQGSVLPAFKKCQSTKMNEKIRIIFFVHKTF